MITAVDLFAGAGGFTTGATQAGARVLYAANHWPTAVQIHAANHPKTQHQCQDLRQANWSELPDHDLLLASPCCQGHSKARGQDKAAHDASRQTAWAVVDCAEVKRPRALIIENIREFQDWKLFPLWRQALELLGYRLTFNVLNAADFGVPQSRERLFIIGHRGAEIHATNPGRAHQAASTLLDWDAGSWSRINRPGRSAATLARIDNGRRIHGKRFLMAYYSGEKGGRSLDKPLGTVTTRDRFALVDGNHMRMLTIQEYRAAMGFPADYQLPETRKAAIHLLGNAVVPAVAAAQVKAVQSVLTRKAA